MSGLKSHVSFNPTKTEDKQLALEFRSVEQALHNGLVELAFRKPKENKEVASLISAYRKQFVAIIGGDDNATKLHDLLGSHWEIRERRFPQQRRSPHHFQLLHELHQVQEIEVLNLLQGFGDDVIGRIHSLSEQTAIKFKTIVPAQPIPQVAEPPRQGPVRDSLIIFYPPYWGWLYSDFWWTSNADTGFSPTDLSSYSKGFLSHFNAASTFRTVYPAPAPNPYIEDITTTVANAIAVQVTPDSSGKFQIVVNYTLNPALSPWKGWFYWYIANAPSGGNFSYDVGVQLIATVVPAGVTWPLDTTNWETSDVISFYYGYKAGPTSNDDGPWNNGFANIGTTASWVTTLSAAITEGQTYFILVGMRSYTDIATTYCNATADAMPAVTINSVSTTIAS